MLCSASRALVAQAVRAERDNTPSDAEEDDLANRLPPVKTGSIQKTHLREDDLEGDSEGEGGEGDIEGFQREKSGERI
jgi:hypothetical protein